MAARVSDSWVFDLDVGVLTSPGVVEHITDVGPTALPIESYQILLNGVVKWVDPAGSPVDITVNVELDLDAYDVSGNLIASWDGGVYPRVHSQQASRSGEQHERVFVEQNIAALPIGTKTLRMRKSGLVTVSSGSSPTVELSQARLSFVTVSIV